MKELEKETFVAFLDVLGFRDIVYNNNHESLTKIYDDLLLPAVQIGATMGEFQSIKGKDGQNLIVADLDQLKVNALVVSDSIMFWTDDTTREDFVLLIGAIRQLLHSSFFIGLPMKGAITYGPITVRKDLTKNISFINTTFFGEGITQAYELTLNQNWAGCLIDNKCLKRANLNVDTELTNDVQKSFIDMLAHYGLLVKYELPYKKGPIDEEYVINWNYGKICVDTVKKAFEKHGKQMTDWAVKTKLENTLNFVRATDHLPIKTQNQNPNK